MEYNTRKIGDRLNYIRVNILKLSQIEFCAEYGIGRNRLSDIENGKKLPPLDLIIQLCETINCDIGYILCEYDEKRKEIANLASETRLHEKAIDNMLTFNDDLMDALSDLLKHPKFASTLFKISNCKRKSNSIRSKTKERDYLPSGIPEEALIKGKDGNEYIDDMDKIPLTKKIVLTNSILEDKQTKDLLLFNIDKDLKYILDDITQ